MANNIIGFQIEIQGQERSVQALSEIKNLIKATEAEFDKAEFGSEEYKKLNSNLAELKARQAEVRAEQKKTQQAFAETRFDVGSYRQLNAEVFRLRTAFKELSEVEREGDTGKDLIKKINVLDTKLKGIDAEIGLFQRNVGDYENAVTRAFAKIGDNKEVEKRYKDIRKAADDANNEAKRLGDAVKKARAESDPNLNAIEKSFLDATDAAEKLNKEAKGLEDSLPDGDIIKSSITGLIPGLDEAIAKFSQLGQGAGVAGTLMAGAFIGVAAVTAAGAGLKAIEQITGEFTKLRTEATALTGATGEALDRLVVGVKTTADVFGTDLTDTLRATNALAKGFNLTLDESQTLIEKFQLSGGLITDDSIKQVEEYSSVLGDANIKAEDLLTVIALAAKGGQFNDFGIDAFKEFTIRLNTDGKKVAAALKELERNVGGTFANKIVNDFETGKATVTETLQAITNELEKLPPKSQPVKKALSEIFGSKGEDVSAEFLISLGNANNGLDAITDKTNIYYQAQLRQLQLDKDLNTAKNELTKRFEGLIAQSTNLTTQVQTGLIKALSYLYDTFAPLGKAIADATVSLYKFGAFDFIIKPLQFVIQLVGAFADGLRFIPAQLTAIAVASEQAGANFRAAMESKFIAPLEVAALKTKRFFTFDPANVAAIDAQIKAIQDRAERIKAYSEKQGKTVGQAYNEALQKEFAKLKTPTPAQIAQKAKQSGGGGLLPSATGETAAAAAKVAKDEQKKIDDQALKDAQEAAARKAALLLGLQKDLIAAQLSILKDGKEKELKVEQERTDAVVRELDLRAKEFANDAEVQKQINAIKEAEAIKHLQNIAAINAKYDADAYRKQLEQYARDLSEIEKAGNLTADKIAELRAKALTGVTGKNAVKIGVEFDTKEYETTKATLLAKLKTLQDELLQLQEDAPSNQLITSDIIDETVAKMQSLNTQLAQLEEQHTAKVAEENGKRAQEVDKYIQKGAQIAMQALDFYNQFAQAQTDRELQAIDERLQARDEEINATQEKLDNASGLQKEALQAQLDEQLDAKRALEKQQAQIEKRAAQRQKATSIIQSLINTALAVSGALASPPFFPANLPSVLLAGVLGAVQTAAIAAQPLATGGIVGGANMRQLPNGDNVLTTLRTGEVVLNETQQSRLQALFGDGIFAAIKVPGFATGGVVNPIPNIYVSPSGNNAGTDIITAMERRTDALAKLVLNMQVSLDTDYLSSVQNEKQRIVKNVTL